MAPTISIGTIAVSDYLGIGIMMIVLTAAFVSMRFFTSLKQSKRLLVDDCRCHHLATPRDADY